MIFAIVWSSYSLSKVAVSLRRLTSHAKGVMKINRWLAQLTSLAAMIALAISPTLGLANTPAKAKGTMHHHARQTVHFQGERPANAQDTDDAWDTPTQSSGF